MQTLGDSTFVYIYVYMYTHVCMHMDLLMYVCMHVNKVIIIYIRYWFVGSWSVDSWSVSSWSTASQFQTDQTKELLDGVLRSLLQVWSVVPIGRMGRGSIMLRRKGRELPFTIFEGGVEGAMAVRGG